MHIGESGLNEEALLVAVGAGDELALRDLYRSFEHPLFGMGLRWYGDRDLAEELVQEVTVRIWRKASTYDPEKGTASAWIFGVARNVATDLARARARRPTPLGGVVSDERNPWDEDGAWRCWEIAKAVKTLPSAQQEVVRLAFHEEYTQSEIAASLKIPLGTVKTRVRLALSKLESQLIDAGVLEGPL